MTNLYKRFKHSNLTVCHELTRQGYLTADELERDKAYGGSKYSKTSILIYRALIIPLVLLMRCSKRFTDIVYKVTHKIWLKDALK